MHKRFLVLCALCVLCGKPPSASAQDGAELLRELEARVVGARKVIVESEVQARGALYSSLKGRLELGERNHAQLSFAGQIGSQPAVLVLSADQYRQELRSGATRREEATGEANNRALALGLLRSGLMHNLTRLSRLQPPEAGGGPVERLLALDNFRPTTYILGGELEGALSFGFDAVVDGAPAASVRLWLDPASGLPRRREHTLKLAAGEATVTENYTRFVVEP